MMTYVSFFSCAVLVLADYVSAVSFNYNRNDRRAGPYAWGPLSRYCDGLRQSPININTNAVQYGKSFTLEYLFQNPDLTGTFQISHDHFPTFKADNGYKLRGVPHHEGDVYQMVQFHFHYGASYFEGSEHLVDGKPYTGEIHLVHFNTKYGTYNNAVNYPDGRAVLGIFFQTGARSNRPGIDAFLWRNLPRIKAPAVGGHTSHMHNHQGQGHGGHNHAAKVRTSVTAIELLPDSSDIYTYAGSTTTPPCRENVQWIVHKHPITLSSSTVQFMRSFEHGTLPAERYGNFRPVQRLNGRVVEANFVPWPTMRSNLLSLFPVI